jgi:hypothetical protein
LPLEGSLRQRPGEASSAALLEKAGLHALRN